MANIAARILFKTRNMNITGEVHFHTEEKHQIKIPMKYLNCLQQNGVA